MLNGSAMAGDQGEPDQLSESGAAEEFEALLAYDWRASREIFLDRVARLYRWAENRPELRSWMAARLLRVAGDIRPGLRHQKLWPLAYLLGQERHFVMVEPPKDGFEIYLYEGAYHAIAAGSAPNPDLIGRAPPGELISAASLSELKAQISSGRAAVEQGAKEEMLASLAVSQSNGLDIPWLNPPALVGSHGHYNVVAFLNVFWGLPQSLGAVDLRLPDGRNHPDVLMAATREELVARIDGLAAT
jgi:hypothetical protein